MSEIQSKDPILFWYIHLQYFEIQKRNTAQHGS